MNSDSPPVAFVDPSDDSRELSGIILGLLERQPEPVGHGGAFTGRPGTEIRCDERHVLKFRQDHAFEPVLALHRAAWLSGRERRFGSAHPDKIWFALAREDAWVVANLTPRLRPLHTQLPKMGNPDERVEMLERVLGITLTLAAAHGYGPDEGLSNFGLDSRNRVYYLDDEYYRWTSFVTLIQALKLWFSSFPWLDETRSTRLGHCFRSLVQKHFADRHLLRTVAEELRNVSLPDNACRHRFAAFLGAVCTDMSPVAIRANRTARPRQARFAVLADIHANLAALRAVLDDMAGLGVEDAIVLGDVVGYGPDPAECIDVLVERGFNVIKGNHDHGIANGSFEKGFSRYARWVAEWTYPRLDAGPRRWLDELPLYIEGTDWLGVHGAPCDRYFFYGYVYQMTYEKNLAVLKERNMPLCFHGHTHMPGVYFSKNGDNGFRTLESTNSVAYFDASLVCPGSVGQPRDGSTGAQYLVFDPDSRALEHRRVPYDIQRTIAAMRHHGFPAPLINRLEAGQ